MKFSLVNEIDHEIIVEGSSYTVNDSFDNVLKIFEIMESFIPDYIKVDIALENFLGEIPKLDFDQRNKLLEKIFELYITNDNEIRPMLDIKGNPMPKPKKRQFFSLMYDAELIFAGFLQDYGINLRAEKGKLCWRDFIALFNGLSSQTRFREVVEIRMRPYPKGKGTTEERNKLRKLKKELSFPGEDFSIMNVGD